MAGFDLSSILQDAIQGAEAFGNLAEATTTNTAAQMDLTGVMVSEARNAQKAATDIAITQGQAKLQTQKNVLKVANTMGTNAGDTGWLIGDMGKRVISADQEAQAALGVIQQKRSIDFIDNPIGYLYAQATIDTDINAFNMARQKSDLAKDTASKLESMGQASFLTQNAIEQSVTESTVKQNAILQGYKYSKEANDAAKDGLRTNLDGMTRAAQANAQAIDFKFKGLNAVNQERAYQTSLEHLRLSQASFNLQAEAKKAKLDEDSLIGKFVAKGFFNHSGQDLDPVRAKEMVALYKAGQPEIRNFFNSGMQSYMISADGKQSVISTSPYDAATSFGSGMVQNLPQAQKDVGDWLVTKRREFNNQAVQSKLNIDPKDKTGQERAFNEFIRNTAGSAARTGADIYTPASLVTVANSTPELAKLPVWKDVLAPMVTAGAKLDDPNLVLGAVTSAIQKGTLSYNDALGLATLYGQGVNLNNMSRNWISTGMPNGTGYIASVGAYGKMGKVSVDLTRQEQLATLLNKSSASAAAMRMRQQMFNNLPGTGN